MEEIVNNMCVQLKSHAAENKDIVVKDHPVCNGDLYDLFGGNHVEVKGNHFQAEFSTPDLDHGEQCRDHQGVEFCKEQITELYQEPHDCVMILDEWHCRDQMYESWKKGCVEIGPHHACGVDMVDIVLQGCVELGHNAEWICPTAVGTKHGGYNN